MKRIRQYTWALLLFVFCFPASNTSAGSTPELRRGVNLSHWLQYWGRQPVVAADMTLIRSAGFDHVRVPFDPEKLGWNPDSPSPTIDWTSLDNALNIALSAGLTVILDFHPEFALSQRIQNEESVRIAYLAFWDALAKHFATRPAEKVAIEIFNEPSFWESDGPARLGALEQEALARIRKSMPRHLVLLPGPHGGFISGLVMMTPVADTNVRYVFHFYEPFLFTHLNAPFEPHLSGPEGMITNLVYPSKSALKKVKLLPNADATIALAAVRQYEQENWGATRLKQEIGKAQAWAKNNGVSVICTEFGAIRFGPDPVSRQNWLRDFRAAMDSFRIGWTVWDYADLFGVATATDGMVTPWSNPAIVPRDPSNPKRAFDQGALRALGIIR